MSINDGGPAFPGSIGNVPEVHWATAPVGMSLRDWFAGMAMQSVIMPEIKRIDRWEKEEGVDGDVTITWDTGDAIRWAESCYVIADAMIAEREKESVNGKA